MADKEREWIQERKDRTEHVYELLDIFQRNADGPSSETIGLIAMLQKFKGFEFPVLLAAESPLGIIPVLHWMLDVDNAGKAVLGMRHGRLPEDFEDEVFLILGVAVRDERFTFGLFETDALGAMQFAALMPEPLWWRNLERFNNSKA